MVNPLCMPLCGLALGDFRQSRRFEDLCVSGWDGDVGAGRDEARTLGLVSNARFGQQSGC